MNVSSRRLLYAFYLMCGFTTFVSCSKTQSGTAGVANEESNDELRRRRRRQTVPVEVDNLGASVTATSITVHWIDPSDSDFASVRVSCSGAAGPIDVPKGVQSQTFTGLTEGEQYAVVVQTVYTGGSMSNGLWMSVIPTAQPPVPPQGSRWLHTRGNRIYRADDTTVWHGRGVNLPDTRSCNACAYDDPNVDELKRRVDEAVDNWHVDFIRIDLESYADSEGRTQWQSVTQDAGYLNDIKEIVRYIGTKNDVYVMLTLWVDPTFSAIGWPTQETSATWQLLAREFKDSPHVIFGLVNEPESNSDGAQDADCWAAMNSTLATIRAVEDANQTPHHLVAVQGTRSWGRVLDYYVQHPMPSDNVIYETHVYDPASDFSDHFEKPAATLPVVIGEFGPSQGMTLDDVNTLMTRADALQLPYLAWAFHMRCPPNLLVDNSGGGCGVGMKLQPTDFGKALKTHLGP